MGGGDSKPAKHDGPPETDPAALMHVFPYIKPRDRLQLALVCKKWKEGCHRTEWLELRVVDDLGLDASLMTNKWLQRLVKMKYLGKARLLDLGATGEGAPAFTAPALRSVIMFFKDATVVSLARSEVTDPSLKGSLPQRWANLVALDLSHCSKITDGGVVSMAGKLKKLEVIDLSHTEVTDKSMDALVKVEALLAVNAMACDGVTEAGEKTMMEGMKKIARDESIVDGIRWIYKQRGTVLATYGGEGTGDVHVNPSENSGSGMDQDSGRGRTKSLFGSDDDGNGRSGEGSGVFDNKADKSGEAGSGEESGEPGSGEVEPEPAKKTTKGRRGRRGDKSGEAAGTGATATVVGSALFAAEDTKPAKKTRARRGKKKNEKDTVVFADELEPPEAVPPPKKGRRGRKAAQKSEEEIEQPVLLEEEPQPKKNNKKNKRGRAGRQGPAATAPVPVAEESPKTTKRGRKGKGKKTEPVVESQSEEEEEVPEVEPEAEDESDVDESDNEVEEVVRKKKSGKKNRVFIDADVQRRMDELAGPPVNVADLEDVHVGVAIFANAMCWLKAVDLYSCMLVSKSLKAAVEQPKVWSSLSIRAGCRPEVLSRLSDGWIHQCARASYLRHVLDLDLGGTSKIRPVYTPSGIKVLGELMPNLVSLSLSCCDIGPEVVKTVARTWPRIERVNLTQCSKVNDSAIQSLAKCVKLTDLDLSMCNVGDVAVTFLGKSTSLHVLSLFGCPVTDNGMARLVRCRSLVRGGTINLFRTQVSREVAGKLVERMTVLGFASESDTYSDYDQSDFDERDFF